MRKIFWSTLRIARSVCSPSRGSIEIALMPPFNKGGLGGFFSGRSQAKYELLLRYSSLLKDLPYLLNNEHRRPSGLSPFQISVGLGSFGKWVGLVDLDFDSAVFHHFK